MDTKQIGTIVLASIGAIFIAFFFLYSPAPPAPDAFEPVRTSMSGVSVCLPHVDASGPQTLECAIGIQTDDGKYYALDLSLMSQIPPNLIIDAHVTGNGVLVPAERLSTNHWKKYPIVGIFSVTDSLQVTE